MDFLACFGSVFFIIVSKLFCDSVKIKNPKHFYHTRGVFNVFTKNKVSIPNHFVFRENF